MLDLGEGNMVKELDEKLASKVGLVTGESFNSNEDGRGGNDEGVQSVDSRHGKKRELDQLRVGWGHMGRFIKRSGWEIWHSYGGWLERQWKYQRRKADINRAER